MANTKQAAKRARKSLHQRDANVRLRTTLRTAIKKIHKAIEAGDKAAAEAAFKSEQSVIDAMDTSGRAILLAGTTVVIALLGMFATGVSFMYGLAIAAVIDAALGFTKFPAAFFTSAYGILFWIA